MSHISPIEGFSWMDVVRGSEMKGREHDDHDGAIYDMNDPRLHDEQLHSRTAGWLQSALSGKELKAEAKAAGCYLEGSRKVLALRLAFKNLSAPEQPATHAKAGVSVASSSTAAKRKRADAAESAPGKAGKKGKKAKGDELLATLAGVDYDEGPVYDSCPEIRRKTTAFLTTGVMTQTALLKHFGVQSKSFCSFMKTKAVPGTGPKDWRVRGQAGAGNRFYPKAYHFFERLRLAQGKPKTPTRLKNELALAPSKDHKEYVEMGMIPAAGCNLKHDNGMRHSFGT